MRWEWQKVLLVLDHSPLDGYLSSHLALLMQREESPRIAVEP